MTAMGYFHTALRVPEYPASRHPSAKRSCFNRVPRWHCGHGADVEFKITAPGDQENVQGMITKKSGGAMAQIFTDADNFRRASAPIESTSLPALGAGAGASTRESSSQDSRERPHARSSRPHKARAARALWALAARGERGHDAWPRQASRVPMRRDNGSVAAPAMPRACGSLRVTRAWPPQLRVPG